jgi:AraC-like DNA-binding protein
MHRAWPACLDKRPRLIALGHALHGDRIDRWYMASRWCLHCYRYDATLHLDGERFAIHPGCVGVIPPAVHQVYEYRGPSRHVYAHFELDAGPGPPVALPAMLDLGPSFDDFARALAEGIGLLAIQRLRAEVRLWDLLWRLVALADAARGAGMDPRVRLVAQTIDERLADPDLAIPDLARVAGVSPNQLTRLVRAHLGSTVVGFLRRRRVERARFLLESTDLPVAEIGRRVGIPDPHAFNKTMRAVAGASPRNLRRQMQAGAAPAKNPPTRP